MNLALVLWVWHFTMISKIYNDSLLFFNFFLKAIWWPGQCTPLEGSVISLPRPESALVSPTRPTNDDNVEEAGEDARCEQNKVARFSRPGSTLSADDFPGPLRRRERTRPAAPRGPEGTISQLFGTNSPKCGQNFSKNAGMAFRPHSVV